MGVAPALSGPEVDRVAVLPAPNNLGSWLGFERNDPSVPIPDARFGVDIRDPSQRSGSVVERFHQQRFIPRYLRPSVAKLDEIKS